MTGPAASAQCGADGGCGQGSTPPHAGRGLAEPRSSQHWAPSATQPEAWRRQLTPASAARSRDGCAVRFQQRRLQWLAASVRSAAFASTCALAYAALIEAGLQLLDNPLGFWASTTWRWARTVEAPPRFLAPRPLAHSASWRETPEPPDTAGVCGAELCGVDKAKVHVSRFLATSLFSNHLCPEFH
jgi:hypothetical protein